jgi:hypothetical protein
LFHKNLGGQDKKRKAERIKKNSYKDYLWVFKAYIVRGLLLRQKGYVPSVDCDGRLYFAIPFKHRPTPVRLRLLARQWLKHFPGRAIRGRYDFTITHE